MLMKGMLHVCNNLLIGGKIRGACRQTIKQVELPQQQGARDKNDYTLV